MERHIHVQKGCTIHSDDLGPLTPLLAIGKTIKGTGPTALNLLDSQKTYYPPWVGRVLCSVATTASSKSIICPYRLELGTANFLISEWGIGLPQLWEVTKETSAWDPGLPAELTGDLVTCATRAVFTLWKYAIPASPGRVPNHSGNSSLSEGKKIWPKSN